MAVFALCSASGSPGVTTTALGLSLLWPRPVLLVEADPTGGSGLLAGYFRGIRSYDQGLVELALSASDVTDLLPTVAQPIVGSPASYVAGPRAHMQASALRGLWEPLLSALSEVDRNGQDVIVDCGRLGLTGWPEPILAGADVSLILSRSHLPAVSATRSWAEGLRRGQSRWLHPGVVVVGEGQPYSAREVSDVLGLPVLGVMADDPGSAAVFHRGNSVPPRFESSPLVRSLHGLISTLQSAASSVRHGSSAGVVAGVQ